MTERYEPPTTELTDPFWAATREHTYLVQWCDRCATPIFYPREVCPVCLSADALSWRPSSGRGVVYAVSVQHRPAYPSLADLVPYAVVLVDLDADASTSTSTSTPTPMLTPRSGPVATSGPFGSCRTWSAPTPWRSRWATPSRSPGSP